MRKVKVQKARSPADQGVDAGGSLLWMVVPLGAEDRRERKGEG